MARMIRTGIHADEGCTYRKSVVSARHDVIYSNALFARAPLQKTCADTREKVQACEGMPVFTA